MKTRSAACLSIDRPGAMTKQGRQRIVTWMRRQAKHLLDHGDAYCDKGRFTARYLYR